MSIQFPLQGARLRFLRETHGYTQEAVSSGIGCTLRTYRNWETGEKLPSTDLLIALSDFYGVSCDYLLCRIDEKSHDLQFIHDETGLSEAAITALQYANSASNKKSAFTLQNQRIISLINIALDREGKDIGKLKGKKPYSFRDLFTLLHDYAFMESAGVNISPEKVLLSHDLSLETIEYSALPLLREAIITEIRQILDGFKATEKQGKKPC